MPSLTKPKRLDNVLIEDTRILFRNFTGRPTPFKPAGGERSFCVIIPPELVPRLESEGWNLKRTKVREDGEEPEVYLQVNVNYDKGRPPRVVMVTPHGKIDLGPGEVETVDVADIKTVDVLLNPYSWEVRGNTGVSAYLKSMFFTVNQDELEDKYSEMQMASPKADIYNDEED